MKAVWAVALGSAAFLALAGHLRANSAGVSPQSAAQHQVPQIAAPEFQSRQNVAIDLIPCPSPRHHDGDAIRCGSARGKSMRLYAIDAPEMPGACRPGRWCVPGDAYASRDHLASLTAGKSVSYRVLSVDRYGRSIVQVLANGSDVSCEMVRDGYAIERYGKLHC